MSNVNKSRYDIKMAGLKEQTLTREQMAHLKELGVDTTKASVVLIYQDEDGHEVDWEDVNIRDSEPIYVDEDGDEWELSENYLDAETGRYDQSYRDSCGVFTLEDILKMLPQKIEVGPNFSKYVLNVCVGYQCIEYVNGAGADKWREFFHGDMLNAAYKTLCWCVEYGYLNKELYGSI